MTVLAAETAVFPPSRGSPPWLIAVAALAATVAAQAAHFAGGIPALGADNDSLMRMVMVQDLIAGQGWFDANQYRMGLEGGFPMHWSRLVDAPLAAIMVIVWAVTGSAATGQAAAMLLWPSLLLATSVFLIVRMAMAAYGAAAFLPALATGTAALASTGIFAAGAVDHHNLQVTLALMMLAGLMSGGLRASTVAGCAAAAMAAVGAEALPYVAAGGLLAGGLFLFGGRSNEAAASGFGLGLAAAAASCFVATVPPTDWLRPVCDGFSIAQAAVAVPAGLGLAAVARLSRRRGLPARLLGLAGLGLVVGAIVLIAFPQCLADPYGGLDMRLRQFWLEAVVEAQPAAEILRRDPAMFAGWYATPLLALVVLAWRGWSADWQRADVLLSALLATAVAVSLWQVRGALFAVPLASVALSGWIASLRAAYATRASTAALVAMAASWILSFGAVWTSAVGAISPPTVQEGAADASGSDLMASACHAADDFATLAQMPAATVVAPSNLGSPILAHTPHRALAGPYHRNVAGNLAALELLAAPPDVAEAKARTARVTLVVFCRGDSETGLLASAAPEGLLARLVAGETPAWLQPVGAAGAALSVFRLH